MNDSLNFRVESTLSDLGSQIFVKINGTDFYF
jgi:hypothetical protein